MTRPVGTLEGVMVRVCAVRWPPAPPVAARGPVVGSGRGVGAALGAVVFALSSLPAGAESMNAALGSAYINNPDLNSARAQLRAIDEGVPQALSGYRPVHLGQRRRRYATSRNKVPLLPTTDWSKGADLDELRHLRRAADLPRLPDRQRRQARPEFGEGGARAVEDGRSRASCSIRSPPSWTSSAPRWWST